MNKNDITITVLTPSYNRAKYLCKLYESLIKQTYLNFIWLVVDDGSTDNTKEVISKFVDENIIKIEYIKKENGGKHTALNIGIAKVNTFLTFIVDSDDILVPCAIETIMEDANKIISRKYCGIAYLKGYSNNKVIGSKFLKNGYDNLNKVRYHDCIKGDKAEVWKTKCLKEIPFIEFKNEKFLGEHFVWTQLSEKYDMFFSNEIIYISEYLEDGLTKAGRVMRIKCPKGGMASSQILLKNDYPLFFRLKNAMLYVCYGKFLNLSTVKILKSDSHFILLFIAIFPGFILYLYWKKKYLKYE